MEEERVMQSEPVFQPERKRAAWYETATYDEVKTFIRSNIAAASRSFIAIGYYLKYVRENRMYEEDGHDSIWDFARNEYGISKSTASRYMTMNDRFSEGGNSPIVAEAYRGFGKSQLQEMLYLNDEQLEQVTPEAQVKQIRVIRQSAREIPYFELPGQLRIDDFLDVMPEPATCPEQPAASSGSTVFSVEDFGANEESGCVAISQQKKAAAVANDEPEMEEITVSEPPEDEIVVDTNSCPPGNGSCRRQEWGTSPEAQKAGHKECVKCWEDWKKLQRVLNTANEHQKEETPPELGEEPTVPATEETEMLENGDLEELSEDEPNLCPEDIEPEEQLEVVQGEEEPMTDMQIAREELEKAKKLLNDCLEVMSDEKDPHIRRLKTKVCALACYVYELDNIENPPPAPVQPELPLLKNNDQRAAFVDAYETWPLWIETVQTGERYYRYNLEDGTSMVVKVYHAMLFDYKTTALKYEERFTEGYGRHEYYLLEPGKFFRNCVTNRSLLIDKLKEIQKAKKG